MLYIILILWSILTLLYMLTIAPMCVDLSFGEKIVIFLICLIGAPILLLAQILTDILNLFLPEGWDNDDDDDFFKRL